MSIQIQITYACRCGKNHLIPMPFQQSKCGCGRIATANYARQVTITDKPYRKRKGNKS